MFQNEVEYMDTSDTPWSWYYLADCGRWHRFEDDPDNPFSSENIENYYLRDSKAVLKISSSSCHNQIDFSVMLQTDLTTGRKRRIQRSYKIERSCSCFTAAPVFWERFDPTLPYQLIPLSDVTPEYQTVASYVKHEGLLNKPIVSISRIQNLDLWEIYCRKKKHLMRIQHVKEIQERRLFHGTDIKNVDSICKYNFDLRLAGQNGNVFGKGIYFATHASYADKYSTSSSRPLPLHGQDGGHRDYTKIMFLARVMVGNSIVGERHFQKPDHGSLENSHDSCVDDISPPRMFVIFDPNQIYPEYLVQYR
ncbi:protein mono-ADP-ribosyltransferase PARP11 [Melanotaenia boesemani]|uniref:protein mono-ADP-ribosyltransferase PARP11 n=1 Tax=Melanotaenia boesemani TaxID=1250792 RepID=UPI001C04CBF7|nr:protein mono-ADP-ribosyltransferase PARP11 [Melanotaenia boesemani]